MSDSKNDTVYPDLLLGTAFLCLVSTCTISKQFIQGKQKQNKRNFTPNMVREDNRRQGISELKGGKLNSGIQPGYQRGCVMPAPGWGTCGTVGREQMSQSEII